MEIYLEHITEVIRVTSNALDKADKMNNRLVNVLFISIVTFCTCLSITLIGISYLYFTTDYNNFGTYNQIQGNDNNATQGIGINKRSDE